MHTLSGMNFYTQVAESEYTPTVRLLSLRRKEAIRGTPGAIIQCQEEVDYGRHVYHEGGLM